MPLRSIRAIGLAFAVLAIMSYPARAVDGWAVVEDLGVPGTTGGGASSNHVTVTTRADLATYCGRSEPYIIFVSGTLAGGEEVEIGSNKTIVGLGTNATLDGFGLTMGDDSNIIIRNLTIRGAYPDAISVRRSHHVWIDHCDLSNCDDGLLDITNSSDYVTVTNTRFSNHSKCCLVNSGTDNPVDIGTLNCTFHHNWWDGTVQRNPRVGYGMVHVFNNLYSNNSSYCVGLHSGCRVLVQANAFVNTNNAIEQMYVLDPSSQYFGFAEDLDNLYVNTTKPNSSTFGGTSFNPLDYFLYDFLLQPAANVQAYVQANAGPKADADVAPLLPLPGNGAIKIATGVTLEWTTTPDVDVISYNVYFGTDSSSPIFQTNTTSRTFPPGDLQTGLVYYWRVDRVTPSGTLAGPLWRFQFGATGSQNDTAPPTPDPMTWAIEPYALGPDSIAMTATTASDPSWVQYYFANLTDPSHDSGWQDSPSYADSGLLPGTTYTYTVAARDLSSNRNQTTASSAASAMPGDVTTLYINFQPAASVIPTGYLPDYGDLYGDRGSGLTYGWNNTHTDNPRERELNSDQRLDTIMHFHAGGVWQIAAPAGEYAVEVTIGDPAFASTYTINVEGVNYWNALSLGINQFRTLKKTVQVSDGKITIDQGNGAEKATRICYAVIYPLNLEEDVTPPAPDPMTFSSNPTGSSSSSITMMATAATDTSGVEYFFDCLSDGGHSSGWQTSRTYVDTGLQPGTAYTYQVRARDLSENYNETGWSGPASATTPRYSCTPLTADRNSDCQVDFMDFASLAVTWTGSVPDFAALQQFAADWLACNRNPASECWQ